MDPSVILQAEHVEKTFRQGENLIRAVNDVSFQIRQGDFVSVIGQSGSGKTTLLNILGCIFSPDRGAVWVGDTNVAAASDDVRAQIRRRRIGYVFQNYQLLPALTVRENIVFPLRLSGQRAGGQEVEGLARMLGIESCLNAFPGRLSGGQQQRVAIARALIHHPQIILADEPTGNLDSRNAAEILNIFSYLNQCGTTILMVTHNPNIAAMCQRRLLVSDGCCTELA